MGSDTDQIITHKCIAIRYANFKVLIRNFGVYCSLLVIIWFPLIHEISLSFKNLFCLGVRAIRNSFLQVFSDTHIRVKHWTAHDIATPSCELFVWLKVYFVPVLHLVSIWKHLLYLKVGQAMESYHNNVIFIVTLFGIPFIHW